MFFYFKLYDSERLTTMEEWVILLNAKNFRKAYLRWYSIQNHTSQNPILRLFTHM